MRPPLGLRPPGGLIRRPQVADFYAAPWPVFTPPLTPGNEQALRIEDGRVAEEKALLGPVFDFRKPQVFLQNLAGVPNYCRHTGVRALFFRPGLQIRIAMAAEHGRVIMS